MGEGLKKVLDWRSNFLEWSVFVCALGTVNSRFLSTLPAHSSNLHTVLAPSDLLDQWLPFSPKSTCKYLR